MSRYGVRSAMLARGALIKPWLFQEIREGRSWLPTPEERFSVLWRFVELLREHFGTDERGQKRMMRFLPWHMNFFCRYVPLPEDPYQEQAQAHPLLQSRLQAPPPASPLERLLGDARPETHVRFSEELLASAERDEALARSEALARALPDETPAAELEVARSEIAG
jgi:tRNA-dihydrouridine synthase 3